MRGNMASYMLAFTAAVTLALRPRLQRSAQ